MMKKLNKKAFTLIELLVVIAVVGILVLLGAPRFTGYTQKAELTRIQHDIKVMEQEVGTVLINKDDDFNKWDNNNKDLSQLSQEGKLFEKEGPVTNGVEPIDEDYKVIPEKYKDKINTKLKGTFYANSGGKVYYEHLKSLSGIPTESEEEPGVPVDPEKSTEPEEPEEEPVLEGPIPIATAEELNNVRNATIEKYGVGTQWEGLYEGGLDKQYFQVADIDLSKYSDSEEGWNPIGTRLTTISKAPFTGTYDGRNYVIRGLEVKGAGKDYQGLFGITHGATIRNVDLIDNKVTGHKYVGSLVGQADKNTKISNSHATGEVKGSDYYVGGLVGWADKNIIEDSYATGPVTGGRYVGGLVGWATYSAIENSYATDVVESLGEYGYAGGLVGSTYDSNISNSYAAGSVTGEDYVGGLVGRAQIGKISKSYAKGSVTGTGDYAGGLVGEARGGTIENSYATGAVAGSYSYGYVGGLVGYINSVTIKNSYTTGSVTFTDTGAFPDHQRVGGLVSSSYDSNISNSYWDINTTKQDESAGGEGKTTDDMKQQTTYSDWDFDNVWKIDEGKDYPKLR